MKKMDINALKIKVCAEIDRHRDRIIKIGQDIYANPELGYKENHSTDYIASELAKLGLDVEKGLAVTGCRSSLDCSGEGPTVAVMGELDAVICREHPDATDEGAVHACGHNVQLAAMVGTAIGLVAAEAASQLAGKIDFIAVPAEEFVELGYRQKLMQDGKIRFFGGKQELLYRGHLDNTDICVMIHALNLGDKKVMFGVLGNGFVGKNVQFIGKESHAGSAPEKGVNALNAAMLAMSAIHAQRETFLDSDKIRVHPIITKGGDIVNVVPADVRLETYVRGRRVEGILDANTKVNRALFAGALAVGAKVRINEIPGYMPLLNCEAMDAVFKSNLLTLVPENEVIFGGEFGGSFDFGDLSQLMPTLHPFTGGVVGDLHTRDFKVTDFETAYILPAKLMAMTLIDLLADKAAVGNKIVSEFKPTMTKDQYFAFQDKVSGEIMGP
jgi:amidohydrolase